MNTKSRNARKTERAARNTVRTLVRGFADPASVRKCVEAILKWVR